MRILHYLPSLSPSIGGPGRAVIDLCDALAMAGHTVTLATADPDRQAAAWSCQHHAVPRLVVVPRPRSPGYWYTRAELDQMDPLICAHDLLHVHGMWEIANVQLSARCRRLGKPYVISPHGMLDSWSLGQSSLKKMAFLKLVGKRWLSNAGAIHMTATAELDDSERHLRRGSGHVVPLLVDLNPYCHLPGPADAERMFFEEHAAKPRILLLSRLHPVKGIEVLLSAARLLVDRGRQFSLVVAGSGDATYLAGLKSLAANLGAPVQFLGMVTGTSKLSLYGACDIFVLPTQHENFGVVFIEALACGLPIVTSKNIALSSELESSGAAILADRTPEQFADAIDQLLLDPPTGLEMGRRGRCWVFGTFDPIASLQRFESFYASVVHGSESGQNSFSASGRHPVSVT